MGGRVSSWAPSTALPVKESIRGRVRVRVRVELAFLSPLFTMNSEAQLSMCHTAAANASRASARTSFWVFVRLYDGKAAASFLVLSLHTPHTNTIAACALGVSPFTFEMRKDAKASCASPLDDDDDDDADDEPPSAADAASPDTVIAACPEPFPFRAPPLKKQSSDLWLVRLQ